MKTPYANLIGSFCFVIALLSVSFAHAQESTASNLKWIDAPGSLPVGTKLALLKGDLSKSGAFAFQLKLPAGYRLMPQSSAAVDRLIVVSGTFNLGAGKKFDNARTIPMHAGYVHWPDNTPFFGWTKDETIIELQGAGPWTVKYVNPADNPVKMK